MDLQCLVVPDATQQVVRAVKVVPPALRADGSGRAIGRSEARIVMIAIHVEPRRALRGQAGSAHRRAPAYPLAVTASPIAPVQIAPVAIEGLTIAAEETALDARIEDPAPMVPVAP